MGNPWDFSGTINAAYDARERQQQNDALNQLREMQIQEYKQNLKEKQELERVRQGASNYLIQNRALLNPTTVNTTIPDYSQSMGLYQAPTMAPTPQSDYEMPMPPSQDFGGNSYEVPAEQTISKTIPARETELSLLGKYYTQAGYPEKGIPLSKQATLDKQAEMKEMIGVLEMAKKLAIAGNEKAANMFVDSAKEAYPMLKDVDFKFDKQTGISTIQKELPNGLIVTQAYDLTGKELGKPHYENKKTETVNDFQTFYRGFANKNPQLKGGELDAAASDAWHKQKANEAIRVGVTVGEARMGMLSKTRGPTVWDMLEKRAIPMTWDEYSKAYENEPGRYISMSDPRVTEMQGAAKQRTGMRAANVITASKVFDQEMPELIRLRKVVQEKGLLPSGGFKDMNSLNQFLGKKVSDPDVAELQKKTKLMADALQRTIGGTQGGQWAFEVAADILDPSYSPPAFERIFMSHSKSLKRMATAYKEFGTDENINTQSTLPAGFRRGW